MFKALIFDFGGVILSHPKTVIPEVIARIYNVSLELVTKEYKKYRLDYYIGKIPTDKFITLLSSAFNSNKSIEEIKKLWLEHYSILAKPNQGVIGIIKDLHKNYKVYLLSNTTEMSHLYNKTTGIYDNFDSVFMSYQMGVKKPHLDIYKKVLAEIGFKPEECIFVDDDGKNLETARNMGITPVLFNILVDSPSKLKEELKKFKVII